MNGASDLEEQFSRRGVTRGGILFLSATDALDLIDSARQQSRPILGVDTFRLTDTTTKPLLDHILDLSVGTVPFDSWAEARKFIEQRSHNGFMFEVVI